MQNCYLCKGSGELDCSSCGKSGLDKDGNTCTTCKGLGTEKCYTCKGSGQIEDDPEPDPDDPE